MHFLKDDLLLRGRRENIFCATSDIAFADMDADTFLERPAKRSKKQNMSAKLAACDTLIVAATEAIKALTPNANSDDSDQVFTEYLSAEMSAIQDEKLKAEVRKKILDLVFEAKRVSDANIDNIASVSGTGTVSTIQSAATIIE